MKEPKSIPYQSHYRQGDILLRQVKELPANAKRETDASRCVLAEGEATGHLHEVENPEQVSLYRRRNAGLWLDVAQSGTRVIHPEHNPITLPGGLYEVIRQREFDPRSHRAYRHIHD